MSNIRSLSDLNKGGGGGGGGGRGPPNGGGGMPPNGPPHGPPGGPPNGAPPGGFLGNFFGSMFGGPGGPGAHGGGNVDHKKVKVLHQEGDLARELSAAGGKLVVVDFGAEWCGPCKMIAPHFARLSEKYPNVVFLKIDSDELQETAARCNISTLPTFHFYIRSRKVDEFSNADPNQLERTIQKHMPKETNDATAPASGGNVLGGGGGGGNVLGGGQALGNDGGQTVGNNAAGREKFLERFNNPAGNTTTTTTTTDGDENMDTTPSTTPAHVSTRPTPPANITADPLMMQNLMDMGFPSQRAQKALVTVKNTSVQAAMDWIFEHMDDPDIDAEADSSSNTSGPTPMDTTTSDPEKKEGEGEGEGEKPPTVHNAICDECKKQIVGIRYKSRLRPDFDLCEKCKKMTTAEDDTEFVAHNEDIVNPTLTPEELALQKQKLQDKIIQLRKKQREDEEARDRERELSRRKDGKDAIEAKQKWEETQAKREAEKIRKEKEDEKRAKEAIKRKIAQDKLERQSKQAGGSTTTTAPPPVAAQPVPQQPAAPKTYTECQIQIRQLDGSSLRATFAPSDTLQAVHDYVKKNRTDKSSSSFTLSNTFPRKVYTGAEMSTTLQAAGLVPNGTLLMQK